MKISPSDRARIERIALAAPDVFPGGDGIWLSDWLVRLLADLGPDRNTRDDALRALYETETKGTLAVRCDQLRRLVRSYEQGRWPRDCARQTMPPGYAGTRFELLFQAFRAGDGVPPLSRTKLKSILLSQCFYKRTTDSK